MIEENTTSVIRQPLGLVGFNLSNPSITFYIELTMFMSIKDSLTGSGICIPDPTTGDLFSSSLFVNVLYFIYLFIFCSFFVRFFGSEKNTTTQQSNTKRFCDFFKTMHVVWIGVDNKKKQICIW